MCFFGGGWGGPHTCVCVRKSYVSYSKRSVRCDNPHHPTPTTTKTPPQLLGLRREDLDYPSQGPFRDAPHVLRPGQLRDITPEELEAFGLVEQSALRVRFFAWVYVCVFVFFGGGPPYPPTTTTTTTPAHPKTKPKQTQPTNQPLQKKTNQRQVLEECLNHHKEFRRLVLLVTWLELLRERDLWLLRDEVDGLVRGCLEY